MQKLRQIYMHQTSCIKLSDMLNHLQIARSSLPLLLREFVRAAQTVVRCYICRRQLSKRADWLPLQNLSLLMSGR